MKKARKDSIFMVVITQMSSNKPYLIRGVYQWLIDNHCTPYIHVDANYPNVLVPKEHIEKNGTILLNINKTAVADLVLGNITIDFWARFKGIAQFIKIPIEAVLAIYAKENGEGMAFTPEDPKSSPPPTFPGKGHLRLVK